MNSKTIKLSSLQKNVAKIFLALLLVGVFTACKKDKKHEPAEPPIEVGEKVAFYKLHRVENLAAETDNSDPMDAKKEVLYSLEYNIERSSKYLKTDLWDISFSEMFNSLLGANNKNNRQNLGSGGDGIGGILILEQNFEDVIDIPSDDQFLTGTGVIGPDELGEFGTGKGWYIYDWAGTIIGDGSADKKHVSYALGEQIKKADGTDAPIRTIVLRTAQGNYAKIKMISCYKDAFTVDEMFKDTPHNFFTFEYVLVPKGSTKFEIK